MNLTIANLLPLLPIILASLTAVVVMLAVAFGRNHWWNATLTVVGLNISLASAIWLALSQPLAPQMVTPLLVVDAYAYFYMAMILAGTLACCTLTHAYMEGYASNKEEIYLLLTIAAVGAMVLVCSRHMASFFIGLELMSVPVYGMVAYTYQRKRSLEAGIKYMVLSATASAFMLFGMALLYALTGNLEFQGLAQATTIEIVNSPLSVIGVGMILIGVAFKLSIAPFHLWTPDVYEGAPAPVGAFLASVGKVAVFAVLLRWLIETPSAYSMALRDVMAVLAVLSIIIGNVLALNQNNIKRILGYSSIAHMGYLLAAVVSGGILAIQTVQIYLLTYVITTLGAFGVITLMSSPLRHDDADALFNYRGLFWRRPILTAVMTIMLLSLAGIPLTAGFIGKFFVIMTGVKAELWWLMGAVVLGSAIGLYYYLRVMVTLYMATAGLKKHDAPLNWGQQAGGVMVLLIAGLVLLLGVYPQPALVLVNIVSRTLLGG
ncbi:NADH dehydrogenase subunit N [Fluviicoccus keumensis]|uniref:NADH-quinone oxidoreductase subunit N n=1 Tax=Fluviicoccus keumensis TaxID=1435465 RepID=A0A4Q7Z8K6_9GAMM|nr:NADH-quinone oxidoreductase subunit NuoN [Fluviicoccus keumensis]RZU46820.1 NADH dehydrogenase subunit N [Fluviicoccus keumensis]